MRKEIWTGGLLAAFLLGGCGSEPGAAAGGQKPVLIVNDLKLTAEDLRQEVARTSPPDKMEWLERVIERELLVQEAQRMGLDRNPDFMRSIERFWKEALLKQLIRRKAKEISAQVQVYEPEVQAYYQHMLQAEARAVEPLEKVRQEIVRAVRQQKEAEAMEQWVAGLRQGAKIEMDRQALEKLQ